MKSIGVENGVRRCRGYYVGLDGEYQAITAVSSSLFLVVLIHRDTAMRDFAQKRRLCDSEELQLGSVKNLEFR